MKRSAVALGLACLLAVGVTWAAPTGFIYTANERAESISQVQCKRPAKSSVILG